MRGESTFLLLWLAYPLQIDVSIVHFLRAAAFQLQADDPGIASLAAVIVHKDRGHITVQDVHCRSAAAHDVALVPHRPGIDNSAHHRAVSERCDQARPLSLSRL